MGVASGRFWPTDAFASLRSEMKPAIDLAGKEQRDMRYMSGLCAKTTDGITLVCHDVEVFEYGKPSNPFALEVFCLGIEQPPYGELFPHHVQAYKDQFEK